jgi:cytochrome P450
MGAACGVAGAAGEGSAPEAAGFDLAGDAFLSDPWPVYARLRARGSVHWSPETSTFVVVGHEAVARGLLDPAFTSRSPAPGNRNLFGLGFFDTDGPTHRTLRRAVAPVFGARAVRQHAVRAITPAVERALDDATREAEVDFVERVAAQVPYSVMADVLGVPDAATGWLRARVRPLAAMLEFPPGDPDEALDALAQLEERLAADATRAGADRRTVLGALAAGPGVGTEALRAAIFLLVAGTETSVCAIANVMACLLAHPAALRRVWEDPALVGAAVRETLRWEPSTHSVLRFARREARLAGVAVPRHSAVVFSVAAANRDEAAFADPDRWDPDRWDPDRAPARSLTFGAGPHTCLGLHLAQREFEILFARLRERVAAIEAAGEPPAIRGHSFRGPEPLLVRWRARVGPR